MFNRLTGNELRVGGFDLVYNGEPVVPDRPSVYHSMLGADFDRRLNVFKPKMAGGGGGAGAGTPTAAAGGGGGGNVTGTSVASGGKTSKGRSKSGSGKARPASGEKDGSKGSRPVSRCTFGCRVHVVRLMKRLWAMRKM